ncbi:MAG: GatB/YqeY domain-containing protein [Anaerolineaceae bacterium]|nr:GatB/YqeY domain-containing protein [Anaerolineaceae bacterium]
MGTKEVLTNALKEAMRSGENTKKQVVRMILSNIKLSEVENGGPLSEDRMIAILHKEVKIRQDAIEGAQQAHRDDLIKANEAELAIIESFLPAHFSEDELTKLVQEIINEVGATSMKDMGQVMKELVPRLEGRASNSEASAAVRNLLQ